MDSTGPMSLLSSPAIYLTDGMMRKAGDEKKNVIQSTWTRSTDFSKASAFPFSVRWTMLLNFGIGIKSGLMIGLLQVMVAITFYAKYEVENEALCTSFGFCDQKVPRLARATFILVLFETAIDTIFGVFFLVRTNHIQNLVFWVSSHSELRPSEMYRVLDIMTWGVFAFSTPMWIFSLFIASFSTYYDNDQWWQYFFHTINIFNTWCTMFLSVLWVWENWLLSKVGDHLVQKRVEMDFGADGVVAGLKCHELLQKMSEVSRVWALNHGFRIVFAFMDVTLWISWYIISMDAKAMGPMIIQKLQPILDVCILLVALAYYLFVVATLLAPGFVSSRFFISLQLKISEMTNWVTSESMRARSGVAKPKESEESEESEESKRDNSPEKTQGPTERELVRFDKQHEVRNFQQTCTMFMVRFAFTKDAGGMHFAGFPISVGQAMTGIFIAAYMQYDICQYIVDS